MLTFLAVKAAAIPGGKTNSLLQKLVNLWANNNGYSKSEASLLCRTRLLLALLRGMARQLERSFPRPLYLGTKLRVFLFALFSERVSFPCRLQYFWSIFL